VLNDSRVIPARLRGANVKTGGQFELLLLEENAINDWWAMMKPGKRARMGTEIQIHPSRRHGDQLKAFQPSQELPRATVIGTNAEGHRRLHFSNTDNIANELDVLGEIPLPPYIRRTRTEAQDTPVPNSEDAGDATRYQTTYAEPPGSVAAPTAGLHFTSGLLESIRAMGVHICFVTLHVGLGTFAPVKTESLAEHVMHEERFEISACAAQIVNAARQEGRRVIAVGTTSVRVLESAARSAMGSSLPVGPRGVTRPMISAGSGRTRIFIHPPHDFRVVDALVTNFHLPCSTLLMLVSAFAAPGESRGREMILSAYATAIRERYRFFSYGDAMLIL